MPVIAERSENRLIQAEGPDDTAGSQVEHLPDCLFQNRLRVSPGLMEVNVHGHRLRPADSVGEADGTAFRQTGGHDVLGDVPGHVGPAAVYLAGVLSGERPAAVGNEAAVGVHHQLPARQAGVRLKAAQDEAPGRVDEDLRFVVGVEVPQGGDDDVAGDLLPKLLQILLLIVLAGNHHSGDSLGPALSVFHGYLGLAVRAEALDGPQLAGVGECQRQPVGKHHGQGEELERFRTGEAVHDTLVASPHFTGAAHSPGDVSALVNVYDLKQYVWELQLP